MSTRAAPEMARFFFWLRTEGFGRKKLSPDAGHSLFPQATMLRSTFASTPS